MILLAFSPLLVIWILAWFRRGYMPGQVIALIAALVVIACAAIWNKAVTLEETEILQGWPPFRTRIEYGEISRIHRIYVSTRYGSVLCLAISATHAKKDIVLPMKSFGLEKRARLVGILTAKAPQARIDSTIGL